MASTMNPKEMKQRLENVRTVASILDFSQPAEIGYQAGFTDEYFEAMHELGIRHYNNGQYNEAIAIFKQLCVLQSLTSKYYKALGAALQASGDYATALKVYAQGVDLAMMDAELNFYAGQCFFLTRNYKGAAEALDVAKHYCEKFPDQWKDIAEQVFELHKINLERLNK